MFNDLYIIFIVAAECLQFGDVIAIENAFDLAGIWPNSSIPVRSTSH